MNYDVRERCKWFPVDVFSEVVKVLRKTILRFMHSGNVRVTESIKVRWFCCIVLSQDGDSM